MASSGRRFSEDEVREIFHEAAHRQANLRANDSTGLTLEELMAVARETGLDPALVSAAAAHVGVIEEETSRYWDVPDRVYADRIFPGALSDELWEQTIDLLRQTFGEAGRAGQAGRIREWSTSRSGNAGPVHVEVRPEDGQSRVAISQSLVGFRNTARQSATMLAGTGVALCAFILAVGGLAQLPVLALVASLMFGLAFVIGFGTYRSARAQHTAQTRRFQTALDGIDLLALRDTAPSHQPVRTLETVEETSFGDALGTSDLEGPAAEHAPRSRTRE